MTDKSYIHAVCKGAIALGSGCMRCEKCADQLAARVKELEAQIEAVGAGGVQALSARPVEPSITLDFKQATELLAMFGGEPGLVTLQHGGSKCHSGPGLYAWYSDLPEEGAEFLGAEPDGEARPAAPQAESPYDTMQLYKDLQDLWSEASAVDTIIGRPDVLLRKITKMRDAVGKTVATYLPIGAAPAQHQQAQAAINSGAHAAELPDVEDMAHSAVQEALACGVSHDVFHRWMRSVMDKTVAALAAAPQAAPAQGPTPDVLAKVESNTWDHFGDILPTLKAISRGDWYWGANSRCKYIEIRIDTRDGGCILYDRDRVRISPEQLAHQSHSVGKMGGWAAQIAAAPQAAPAQEPAGIVKMNGLHDKTVHLLADVDIGTLLYTAPQAAPEIVADMFWDSEDNERFGCEIDEIIYDYGPGDRVKIDCAKRLPSIEVLVVADGDDLSYQIIDAALTAQGGAS